MSYNKLGFTSGQTLKAEHLNHMEEGIANASDATSAIIDVLELPTENIRENAFYRLITAKIIFNQETTDIWSCQCVESLPEIGYPIFSGDLSDVTNANVTAYYNNSDDSVYGYVTDELSAMFGVPANWYPIGVLVEAVGFTYNGVINDIGDDPMDSSFRVLLSKEYYIYQDGWCKVPFAYERAPEFDIQWDGVIGDRFALDLTSLGFADTYLVKISDMVLSAEEILGATYTNTNGYECTLTEGDIDNATYPGALSLDGGGITIMYSADDLNAALGLPSGHLTNGTYFIYIINSFYTNRLVAPAKITKIDSKYLDVNLDVESLGLHSVATSGNYYDLWNKPNIYTDVVRYSYNQGLSSTNKQNARNNIDVYSKSEVDTKIANSSGSVDLSAYAKKTDLNSYAKISDIPTIPTKISTFTNDVGYVKTSDLDSYAKKTDVPTVDTALSTTSANTVQNKVIKAALDTKLDIDSQAEVMNCEWGRGNQYIKLSLGRKYAAGQLLLIGESGISLTLIYTSSEWTVYRHLGDEPYKIYQSADEPQACYLQMSNIAGILYVRLKPLGLYNTNISDITTTAVNVIPENATEVSIIEYATKDYVTQKITEAKLDPSDIDLSEYAKKEWVANQGYITSIPSEYITENELNAQGYAKTSDVKTMIAEAKLDPSDIDLSEYAKTADVYSKSEVDTKITNAVGSVDLSAYAKTTDLADYAKTTDLADCAKTTDLIDYAKTTEVETMIAEAIGVAIGGSY